MTTNDLVHKIANYTKLSREDEETLLHDINNLRSNEWEDFIFTNGSEDLIKAFCENTNTEYTELDLLAANIREELKLNEHETDTLRNNLTHYNTDGWTDIIMKKCKRQTYKRYLAYIKGPVNNKPEETTECELICKYNIDVDKTKVVAKISTSEDEDSKLKFARLLNYMYAQDIISVKNKILELTQFDYADADKNITVCELVCSV